MTATTDRHIHRWFDAPIADGSIPERYCAVNNCGATYPKGWTVGDKPTVATTGPLVTAVRDFREAEAGVAEAIEALRAAQRNLSAKRHNMHEAGRIAGIDNAIPSKRWPDVIGWVRGMDES
jgi:hypothetical protein